MTNRPNPRFLLLFFLCLLLGGILVGCGGSGTASTTGTGSGSVTATAETSPAAAQITWTAASLTGAQSFVAYNVYRDGSAVATLSQSTTTFTDSSATASHSLNYTAVPSGVSAQATSESASVATVLTGVAHTYTVTVVYLDETNPSASTYHEVSLGTSGSVTLTVGTTTVTAAEASATSIAVTWTAPTLTSTQTLIAYNVYRDSSAIASASGSTLTFTDATTTAKHDLTYSTVVAGVNTAQSSQTVSVTPVTLAVAHTYNVTAVYLDSSTATPTYHEVSLGTSAAITLPSS